MRTFFVKTDSKKFCQICGRNGHEDESCAALPVTFAWYIIYFWWKKNYVGDMEETKSLFAVPLINGKSKDF